MNNIEMFTWNLFTIDRDTFVDVCMHSFSYFIPIYNAICDNVSEFVAKLCMELIFSMCSVFMCLCCIGILFVRELCWVFY